MDHYQSHRETGSSLADVSDTASYAYYRPSYSPPEHFSSLPEDDIAQKSHSRSQTRNRLQSAIRTVSSSLDGLAASRERAAQTFEMKQLNGSFDSLGSSASSEYFGSGNHWQGFESGKDPQRLLFTEGPRTDVINGNIGIPRLPFPLISLPEAAKLQKIRIERGEEDHTDLASSFATKTYSETRSTISSNSPRTPHSVLFSQIQMGGSRDRIDKYGTVYSRWESPRSLGKTSSALWCFGLVC